MNNQEKVLNWRADILEGKINNCMSCDNIDSNFKCKDNICKYKIQYNEILNKIDYRTKSL